MFRNLVSRTRCRYVEGEYDLDLSYICPNRIIGMSYPGQGTIETQYRNDASQVSHFIFKCYNVYNIYLFQVKKFLDEKHGDKYYVFNVSERKYSKDIFDGRVSEYNWQDHHAPPFHMLFCLVDEMKNWLQSKSTHVIVTNNFLSLGDPENVVVIHCNSGKGRAGTSTCCLLLYLGFYDTVYDAAKHFSFQRFTDGKGISQPC